MILTKSEPFTKGEIQQLREQYDSYIKIVIDIEKKVCSAGCNRHYESEKMLLDQGSKQENVWGGGLDLETKTIDGNSFINIRLKQGNTSNEIQDSDIRKSFEEITRYFFDDIWRIK
jgi:FlaG/FlaF family flagellin (archaellin)